MWGVDDTVLLYLCTGNGNYSRLVLGQSKAPTLSLAPLGTLNMIPQGPHLCAWLWPLPQFSDQLSVPNWGSQALHTYKWHHPKDVSGCCYLRW